MKSINSILMGLMLMALTACGGGGGGGGLPTPPGGGGDDNGTAGERFSKIVNCNGAPYQVQAQIEVEIIPDETEFGFSANLEYSDNLPITFELTSVALTEHVQCVNTPCLKHTELQNGKWLNVIGWKEGSNFYLNLNYFNEYNYDVNITCSTTLMAAPE